MEESGSHQLTIGLHQGNVNPHQAESGGTQRNNSVVNPQQRGNREGSVQTTHTSKSQSRGKSHVSHAKNEKDMQCEIDELKKKLRCERQRLSEVARNIPFPLIYCFKGTLRQGKGQMLDKG